MSKRVSDKQDEMYNERMQDTYGWFLEAISESALLPKFRDAVVAGDEKIVLGLINMMINDYLYPSEGEAEEELLREGL